MRLDNFSPSTALPYLNLSDKCPRYQIDNVTDEKPKHETSPIRGEYHATHGMPLCEGCRHLEIHAALSTLRGGPSSTEHEERSSSHPGPGEPITVPIDNWHQRLQHVEESSHTCGLCALIMKGWRRHRPVVVESVLQSGDMPTNPLPRDLYDEILLLQPYRTAEIVLLVEQGPDVEGLNLGHHAKSQFFLRVELHPTNQASYDHCVDLAAVFRITSNDGWGPLEK